jgi:hypothetical protein
VLAMQAKFILGEPLFVYSPSKKIVQWDITAKVPFEIQQSEIQNTYVHVFSVSPGGYLSSETEKPVAKIAVTGPELKFDVSCREFDIKKMLRFRYGRACPVPVGRFYTFSLIFYQVVAL